MSPQEQRSNNSPVEEDPVDTDTQTIDSLAQQTIDGHQRLVPLIISEAALPLPLIGVTFTCSKISTISPSWL